MYIRKSFLVVIGMLAILGAVATMYYPNPLSAKLTSTAEVSADKLSIEGYDPVGYFTVAKAVKGNPDFTASFNNQVFAFASKENRNLFLTDPEKYSPQYGSNCALGMSFGRESPVDPTIWQIVDGKLYLLLNPGTKTMWHKKQTKHIGRADKQWKKMKES